MEFSSFFVTFCVFRGHFFPRTTGYAQISYTRQMKSRTEYVRRERVAEIREQIATYKRFKRLIDQWLDLSIERSQLAIQIAKQKTAK